MWKQISSNSFKNNITYKLYIYIYIYKRVDERRISLLYPGVSILYTLIQAQIWDQRKSLLYPELLYPGYVYIYEESRKTKSK